MESNRGDSEVCLEKATQALRLNDFAKARRLAEKSNRLYPSKTADDLLNRILQMEQSEGSSKSTSQSDSTHATRSTPESNATSNGTQEAKRTYTQEQVSAVSRVRKCRDFYDILGLTKDCSDNDIKKAYRKLALQFHPDKNHAPGATEAFKSIGKAFATLSSDEKRRRYDLYGPEDEVATTTTTRRRTRRSPFDSDDRAEFDAEELFNMFFGGGFPTGNMQSYRSRTGAYHFSTGGGGHHHTQRGHARGGGGDRTTADATFSTFLQLMPLILLLLMSLFSSLLVSDPPYAFSRSSKYVDQRRTGNLDVVYWVKKDFLQTHTGEVHKIERQVEEDYVSNLRVQCIRERNYKENALWRARVYSDSRLWEEAQKLDTPSCTSLNRVYG